MFPWTGWLVALNVAVIIWGVVHLIRRSSGSYSSARAAGEWTADDLVACILSAFIYFNGLAATALVLINFATGWMLAAATVFQLILMFRIIDPKLKTVSETFEKKQKEYLEELDRIVEWE
ncbi:MAG: hypothetical protein FVQ81_14365 [Candidatus Glassbacteria bacterium]|nr:hypothetical protein [Candidatus Glassbacteria bacterium]